MKKVLISTIALLMLSALLIAPIKAKTVKPYTGTIEIYLIAVGKDWTTADGIRHIQDAYWLGTEVSEQLGTNKFEDWENFNIDTNTGEGTFHGKWLLSVTDEYGNIVGTIGGSACGTITAGYIVSGMFVGTHGIGTLEDVKKMGYFDGALLAEDHLFLEFWGTIVYP